MWCQMDALSAYAGSGFWSTTFWSIVASMFCMGSPLHGFLSSGTAQPEANPDQSNANGTRRSWIKPIGPSPARHQVSLVRLECGSDGFYMVLRVSARCT